MLIILRKSVPFVAAPHATTPPLQSSNKATLRCRFCSFQAGYFDKILVDISSDQLGFWSDQSKDHSDAILQSIWVHVGGHVHGPIYLMSTLGLMFLHQLSFDWLLLTKQKEIAALQFHLWPLEAEIIQHLLIKTLKRKNPNGDRLRLWELPHLAAFVSFFVFLLNLTSSSCKNVFKEEGNIMQTGETGII